MFFFSIRNYLTTDAGCPNGFSILSVRPHANLPPLGEGILEIVSWSMGKLRFLVLPVAEQHWTGG